LQNLVLEIGFLLLQNLISVILIFWSFDLNFGLIWVWDEFYIANAIFNRIPIRINVIWIIIIQIIIWININIICVIIKRINWLIIPKIIIKIGTRVTIIIIITVIISIRNLTSIVTLIIVILCNYLSWVIIAIIRFCIQTLNYLLIINIFINLLSKILFKIYLFILNWILTDLYLFYL
jgi:hypothetical protein